MDSGGEFLKTKPEFTAAGTVQDFHLIPFSSPCYKISTEQAN
jgi:hypothetical protein